MSKTVTSQFWIGKVDTVSRFNDFIGENDEYWSDENEENETIPLSNFIATQGQGWYDHDFLEAGYSDKAVSVAEKFEAYSWVNQWASIVELKMAEHGLNGINTFIMMRVDEPPQGARYVQVAEPRPVSQEGVELVYIGEITHRDEY